MIDVHSHILPGVDDGSASMKESLQMLSIARRQGITDVFATSHYSRAFPNRNPEKLRQLRDELMRRANRPVKGFLVCTGAVLGFIGAYEPFVKFAGAGASVPLLGFGNVLWKGVKEAVDKNGFLGIFLGGFKASAAGISAALIFGYLASLIFEPKMKK